MPIAASNGTFSEPARTDGYHDMRIISPESDPLPEDLTNMSKDELVRLCKSLHKYALEVQANQKKHHKEVVNYYEHYEDYKRNLFKAQSELDKYKFLYEEERSKADTVSDGWVGQRQPVRNEPAAVSDSSELLPAIRPRRSLSESMSEENNLPTRVGEDSHMNTRRTHSTDTQEFSRLPADGDVHDSAEMPDLLSKVCQATPSMHSALVPSCKDYQSSLSTSDVFLKMGQQSFTSVSTQTESSLTEDSSKKTEGEVQVSDKYKEQREPTECSGMNELEDVSVSRNKSLDKVKKRYSLGGLFKKIKSRGVLPTGSEETLTCHKPEGKK